MEQDRELVKRCLTGDNAAWEALLKSHVRKIYNLCYRFTGRSSINAWRTLYYLTKVSLALILLPPGSGELMLNREDSP